MVAKPTPPSNPGRRAVREGSKEVRIHLKAGTLKAMLSGPEGFVLRLSLKAASLYYYI